jgi:drug/metabolite transporter (DMT)-like permease
MNAQLARSLVDHGYIAATILFTVYSQLVLRWQAARLGAAPDGFVAKLQFVLPLFLNGWVLSALVATFLAGMSWMLAMTRFQLSYAFPFASLSYIFIMFAAFVLFREPASAAKVVGTLLVFAGLVVIARG